MNKTPLFDDHEKLGAKMMPFAGYDMPLKYTTIIDEHKAVRQSAGIFDVSHMGQFIIKGKEAEDLLMTLCCNNISKINIGQAQYTCMLNKQGGIIDDLIIYRLEENKCAEGEKAYMLVVNASNMQQDWDWIKQHDNFEVDMINISDKTGLIALQGPKALDILQGLTEVDLKDIKFYHFKRGTIDGIDNVIISGTGYTGSGGFELYLNNENISTLWNAIINHDEGKHLKPAGLGARDSLRLEMGYNLHGNDIDQNTTPIEANISWTVKLKNRPDFNGKAVLADQRKNGTDKRRVGFIMEGRRVPRKGYIIFDKNENEIGVVSSGVMSPTLESSIGMGYVQSAHSNDDEIMIQVGKKYIKANIVNTPFVQV